jgi:hypothetical protein
MQPNKPNESTVPSIPQKPDILCDFCNQPLPTWWYNCDPFTSVVIAQKEDGETVRSPFMIDDGQWAACDQCKAIIDSGDRTALTKRSVDSPYQAIAEMIATSPELRETLLQRTTEYHSIFWSTHGEAMPLEPKPIN